jgi:hypothetical protein
VVQIERVRPSDNPSAPWDAIEQSPEKYFDMSTLPAGIPLIRPESLTRSQVYILVDHILAQQSTTKRVIFLAEIHNPTNDDKASNGSPTRDSTPLVDDNSAEEEHNDEESDSESDVSVVEDTRYDERNSIDIMCLLI